MVTKHIQQWNLMLIIKRLSLIVPGVLLVGVLVAFLCKPAKAEQIESTSTIRSNLATLSGPVGITPNKHDLNTSQEKSDGRQESIGLGFAARKISSKGVAFGQLSWENNLEKTLQLARKGNKMVLVDIYTDWCGWCKKLDRTTYADPQVIAFVNDQFVCLKINAEDGGAGQDFARRHQISGYPCTMVLDADGRVRGTFYGYRAASQFIESVRDAVKSTSRK